MDERNRFLFEEYMIGTRQPYQANPNASSNEILHSFVKKLFEMTDEFNTTPNNATKDVKKHLAEVLCYAKSELGDNSRFVQDLKIELDNQLESSYYDYLLRLRAIYEIYML